MCLAVPMLIKEIFSPHRGLCDLDGSLQEVDISLIEDAVVGDYVIIHAGFAIERLDREEADTRLALFEELATLREALV
ncbi:MAG: HypC/HybG/HupF family hydrogenase formation chaperone [Lentisphaerae bacterium]|nr:HypC/HybG/HupF family hydrogenase formation chaperone [Lentisphaerota bacterium]